MKTKIKVTLILADRVRNELKLLDQAENDRDCHSKALAISVAKNGVRNALNLQMANDPSNMDLTVEELEICKQYFRDVGMNTFVFEEKQMSDFKAALLLHRRK